MKQIRVVVLDDSLICRERLRVILEAEGDISVVGEGINGDHVLSLLEETKPEILLVDLEMPGTAGQATIERVMANQPLPVLVVTGQPEGVRRDAVFEAIRRGALELAQKPAHGDRAAEQRLRRTVRQLSSIPVVRHVAGRLHHRPSRQLPAASLAPPPSLSDTLVLGVGASAGGPLALAALLRELPADFPAAIAVVQHLPRGFAAAFADYLRGRIGLCVETVSGQVAARPACVFLPGDDLHLSLSRGFHFVATSGPPVEGHRPAVDVLFHSLAVQAGANAAGVILSGIGKDGVSGLSAMRKRGGFTLAQDQESCAVFGMPRAAKESGAALRVGSPSHLAQMLCDWVVSKTFLRAHV